MFETTKKYLAEILNQKNKLINALVIKGIPATTKNSLEELTLKLERLGATYFCARGNSDHKVILRLKGTGNISVLTEGVTVSKILTPEEYTDIEFMNDGSQEKFYLIENVDSVTELDISNNHVNVFVCGEKNNIQKLVLHNNDIETLNVSNLKELQFLHMFNNPVCSNLEEMRKIIDQLPDRNTKPFGSIIMYDWVNLGLCGYRNPEDGKFYYEKDFTYPTKIYDNEIYRDVLSVEHPWYQYKNGQFVELEEYNNLVMLRRKLEGLDTSNWTYTNKSGSIFKNWVFGSAIQYNKEAWRYCDFPFRYAHIEDVWETAEKGEGVGITCADNMKFIHPIINYSRMHAYAHRNYPENWEQTIGDDGTISYEGGGIKPVSRYTPDAETIKSTPWLHEGCYQPLTSANLSSHGDMCFSFMGDRGPTKICNSVYGIAPESRYYLVSLQRLSGAYTEGEKAQGYTLHCASTLVDYLKLMSKSVQNDQNNNVWAGIEQSMTELHTDHNSDWGDISEHDINIFTSSLGNVNSAHKSHPQHKFSNLMMSELGKYMMQFNAQGNSGDGLPYTSDHSAEHMKESGTWIDNYTRGSECCYVSSLGCGKNVSSFSSSDRTDKPYTYDYSCYGEKVRYLNPKNCTVSTSSGTSYATPLHAAETALLLVIFGKINNCYRLTSQHNKWYVKNSIEVKNSFKLYLDNHLDPLNNIMRLAVGKGTIDMRCFGAPLTAATDYTNTFIANTEVPLYSKVLVNQITECEEQSYLNKGHHIASDISATPPVGTKHTSFLTLEPGNYQLTVYNNQLNSITTEGENGALYGITDDFSEHKEHSKCSISVSADRVSLLEDVAGGTYYDVISDDASTSSNYYTTGEDIFRVIGTGEKDQLKEAEGWTLNVICQYTFLKEGVPITSVNRTMRVLRNRYFTVCVQRKSSSGNPFPALDVMTPITLMGTADYNQTYLAYDKRNEVQSGFTIPDGVALLNRLRDKKFILTIKKVPKEYTYEFYINGQYITSHTFHAEVPPDYTSSVEGIQIVSLTHNQYMGATHACLHNRPLSEDEIAQQVMYMHKTYIKDAQ